jgi:hypothetical protein
MLIAKRFLGRTVRVTVSLCKRIVKGCDTNTCIVLGPPAGRSSTLTRVYQAASLHCSLHWPTNVVFRGFVSLLQIDLRLRFCLYFHLASIRQKLQTSAQGCPMAMYLHTWLELKAQWPA